MHKVFDDIADKWSQVSHHLDLLWLLSSDPHGKCFEIHHVDVSTTLSTAFTVDSTSIYLFLNQWF